MKANLCRREYVDYPGLSDVLFTAAMTGHDNLGFFLTLTFTGVGYRDSLPLIERFLQEIEWQP